METLVIRHVAGSDPAQFEVVRQKDGKSAEPIAARSPFDHPVEGRPNSSLMAELRWYLERFLDYPFSPETDHAERVQDALRAWGKELFNALRGTRLGGEFFHDATRHGYEQLFLQISSDDPNILGWPWEAIYDPQAGFLAHICQIERRLNQIGDPIEASGKLPRDCLNILLVTARPFEGDVRYRSMSRPLVEMVEKSSLPVHVHLLRPPTFDRLLEHLGERPEFYHILHFDGHGSYGEKIENSSGGYTLQGRQGHLFFEKEDGTPFPVRAVKLSPLLREHAIPCVVLNACQSAMVDERAEAPFASVAAALLQSGVRSVVAMAYSLYVSGGKEFLPAFYKRLFESGNVAQATRAGRQRMLSNEERTCARGKFPLQDWLVPVLYQQDPLDFSFAAIGCKPQTQEERLPVEARDEENPYGFVGRDGALLELERAIRRLPAGVLICGLAGVGKTSLARGFLEWLSATQGLGQGAFWFGFHDIRSAEYVLNQIGESIFGPNFLTENLDRKMETLVRVLREHPFFIVWDNFEVVRGIAGTEVHPVLSEEDRGLLFTFLKRLRGGKSKVLVTSRSEEEWLSIERYKIRLGGLQHEERWEYCNTILQSQGIHIERDDPDLIELMDYLGGHPLAMRVVLPALNRLSASAVLSALKSNVQELVMGEDEAQRKVFAVLEFAEDALPSELKPLLIPLAFHEQFVDAKILLAICQNQNKEWRKDQITDFLRSLTNAGLLQDKGQGVYAIHPAFCGYLCSTTLRSVNVESVDNWARVFVCSMGIVADKLIPLQLHQQRGQFSIHKANFYKALKEAERLGIEVAQAALGQALASYAQKTRSFKEAEDRLVKLAEIDIKMGDAEGEAAAYFQLGRNACEQRDFASAEKWYRKGLEISERIGNHRAAGKAYHQLGVIAEQLDEFEMAERRCLKALEIKKKFGDETDVASTYHELSTVALRQKDFDKAKRWILEVLPICEKHGIEHGAALCHQHLGIIAQEQGNFEVAEEEYFKALQISKKLGDEGNIAIVSNQLGTIALRQNDQGKCRTRYLEALQIFEKRNDQHSAASTYGNLGVLERSQGNFVESGMWFIKSMLAYARAYDQSSASKSVASFLATYEKAPESVHDKLKTMWAEAGRGPFPTQGSAMKDLINNLNDASATRILQTMAQTLKGQGFATEWQEGLRQPLQSEFGLYEGTEFPSEGEAARQSLLLLSEDPDYREGLGALLKNPLLERFDMGLSIAVIPAVLIILQTHVRLKRDKSGKWEVLIEKKPTQSGLLKSLVQSLLSLVGKE